MNFVNVKKFVESMVLPISASGAGFRPDDGLIDECVLAQSHRAPRAANPCPTGHGPTPVILLHV